MARLFASLERQRAFLWYVLLHEQKNVHSIRRCLGLLFAFVVANNPNALAQSWLYPWTLADVSPLQYRERPESARFLPSTRFWGEAGLYTAGRDVNHRWEVAIGGVAEIAGAKEWSVYFESAVLLAVDPNNNVAFNPRAFFWNEGIFVAWRGGASIWTAGLRQLCKHDVDNVELEHERGLEQQRSIIDGGLVARWERDGFDAAGLRVRPLLEAQLTLTNEDQRFPVSTRSTGPSVDAFLGSLRARLTTDAPLAASMRGGLTLDLRGTLLGEWPGKRFRSLRSLRIEAAVEGFVSFDGAAGAMMVFARYADMDDDFISTPPRSATLLALGVRIVPN
jgi:hypothetical protein